MELGRLPKSSLPAAHRNSLQDVYEDFVLLVLGIVCWPDLASTSRDLRWTCLLHLRTSFTIQLLKKSADFAGSGLQSLSLMQLP